MKSEKPLLITIDAKGKTFGRICSQVAYALQSKGQIGYKPNKEPNVVVQLINAKSIRFSGKKLENKMVIRHSRYPGGLSKERLAIAFINKPKDIILRSIRLMLPKNRMQRKLLKKLKISL